MNVHVLGRGMLAAFLLAAAAGCGGDENQGQGDAGPGQHSTTGKSWTVLVYMTADNNLEPFALQDLTEMMAVGSSTADGQKLNIVVQVDRAVGFNESPIGGLPNFTTTKRVLVQKNSLHQLQDLGELDMGKPATLSDFVAWGLRTYPADRVALILWDHGSAWQGFGLDDSSNALLSVPQIQQGIAEGRQQAGAKPFALVGFDACLMATYEVAQSLAPHAEYLLASEELEPGHGWDWKSLQVLRNNSTATPVALGQKIIQDYREHARANKEEENITLSLVDLYKLDTLAAGLKALVDAYGTGGGAIATAYGRGLSQTLQFGELPDPSQSSNMVDVGDLATKIAGATNVATNARNQITEGLKAAVLDSVAGSAKAAAKGLSIYFPPAQDYYRTEYKAITAAASWVAFLENYFKSASNGVTAPAFIDANHIAHTQFTSSGLLIQGTLKPESVSSVAETMLFYGYKRDNDFIVLGEQPAELADNSNIVRAIWDLSGLMLTQGGTRGFTYSAIKVESQSQGSIRGALNIMLAYKKNTSTDFQYCLRQMTFTIDPSGTATFNSDTYYLLENGAFGELVAAPGSRVYPLLQKVDGSNGTVSTFVDTARAFTPSQDVNGNLTFDIDLSFETFSTGTPVFGVLQALDAAGRGDAVSGKAVVP